LKPEAHHGVVPPPKAAVKPARGGSPTYFDRALCSILGAEAVERMAAGKYGEMVAYQGPQVGAVKITEAIGCLTTMPPSGSMARTARALGICLGD